MKTKLLMAGAAAILVAGAGGGYVALTGAANAEVREALKTYEANLQDGQTFAYTDVNVGLTGATLTDVRHSWDLASGPLTLEAAQVTVADPVTDDNGKVTGFGSIAWENAVLIHDQNAQMITESGAAEDVTQLYALGEGQLPVSALSFSGMTLTSADDDGQITIDTFESNGITDYTLADARMENLRVDIDKPLRVGEITATAIDLTALSRLGPDPDAAQVMAALSERSAGTLTASDIVMPQDGSSEDARIDTVKLDHQASKDGAIRMTFDARGFSGPVPADNELASFGAQRVDGDFAATYAFNPAKGDLAIQDVNFTLQGFGTLSGAIHLAGLPDVRRMAATPNRAAMKVALREASLSWHDDGALDRIVERVAREQDMQATAVRSRAAQDARGALDPQTAEALGRFIQDGGTLSLSAKPDQPVPFEGIAMTAMMRPKALREGLKLEVSAD